MAKNTKPAARPTRQQIDSVLDLARQNVIDDPEMEDEAKRQRAAIRAVGAYLRQKPRAKALLALCSTVENLGGVYQNPDGTFSPAGDPEWIDLGEAYIVAVEELRALGLRTKPPLYVAQSDLANVLE
jgi:hypothetical protein